MGILSNIAGACAPLAAEAAEALAETVWPTRCAICDAPGQVLCDSCRASLPYVDWWRACPRCGAPFGRVQCCECNEVMLAAQGRTQPAFDGMAAAVSFDEGAARIVRTWKDAGERRLAPEMARLMLPQVPPAWLANAVAAPIPASATARRRRGFDHGRELACTVADLAGIPVIEALARPRTFDQRALGRRGRIANLQGRFQTLPGATVPARILLIDDVCTTGSTMNAACDALRAAGAVELHCLVFARV